MANRSKQRLTTSNTVNRQAAEDLQATLFKAAQFALDDALKSGTVPAALLSSVQTILRDANLAPDLSEEPEEASEGLSGPQQSWLRNLEAELGL